MRQLLCISIFFFLLSTALAAQKDSLNAKQPPVAKSIPMPEPDLDLPEAGLSKVFIPRKALLWSIIPSGGQIYNRRWWKVPLISGAFSGAAAVLNFNSNNYRRFETAYQLELAGKPHEFTGIIDGAERLNVFRKSFNKSRQTGYFLLAAIYILQSVEAYVDTQLRDFDMNEDLSQLQIRPLITPFSLVNPSPVMALALTYTF